MVRAFFFRKFSVNMKRSTDSVVNRPLLPLFQNESRCTTFHVTMSFNHKFIQSNKFSFEWFRTGTRFETEAKVAYFWRWDLY